MGCAGSKGKLAAVAPAAGPDYASLMQQNHQMMTMFLASQTAAGSEGVGGVGGIATAQPYNSSEARAGGGGVHGGGDGEEDFPEQQLVRTATWKVLPFSLPFSVCRVRDGVRVQRRHERYRLISLNPLHPIP